MAASGARSSWPRSRASAWPPSRRTATALSSPVAPRWPPSRAPHPSRARRPLPVPSRSTDVASVLEAATPACVAETEGAYAPSVDAGQCWRIAVHTLFRRPVFDDTESARAVSRLHRQGGPWSTSRCLAWVLLPECWQALVQVGEGDSLEWLVQRFKTASARLVDPRQRINGWLWERGFD